MRPAFAVLVLSSLTFAQTTTKPATEQSKPAATPSAATSSSAAKAPDNPNVVVTIAGFCPGKQETGSACKTEISKDDFEKLAKALGVPDARKRELATAYSQFLVLSTMADEKGLDKRPDIQEILRFVRMQTLSQLYGREMREEAAKIPQTEIDAYYKEHTGEFSQVTLQRVFIPKMPPNPQEKIDEAAVKTEGAKILTEAKKPDADFTKLQKQAYDDLKVSATPPPTEIHRESIPQQQAKALDAAVGEVTNFDEDGGIYIYKMVSKKTQTETEAEPDIKKTLEQQRFQTEMTKTTANIKPELNEAYFGGGAPERPLPQERLGPGAQSPVTPGTPPASKVPASGPKSSTTPPKPK